MLKVSQPTIALTQSLATSTIRRSLVKQSIASVSTAAPNLTEIQPPKKDIPWDTLTFSLTKTDFMTYAENRADGEWKKAEVKPYGPISLEPSATVLNYGQGIFEGIKAFRTVKDRIMVFRPAANGRRFASGAKNFLMPPVPEDIFLDAINKVVVANSAWIPPVDKGALYLRPLLFGSGAQLGVAPSANYTFCIFVTPVGPYFKGGLKGIDLFVSDWHRSAKKGAGNTKAIGNYAPCFKSQKEAKQKGFSEALYLDAAQDKYVEEAGASNFFCVMNDGTLHTPELSGSILPGVTRESIISLARQNGVKVFERKIAIEEVLSAKEAFCSGTGAVISPVASITYRGNKIVFNDGAVGTLTKDLYNALTSIQSERSPDLFGWLHDPLYALKNSN